MVLPMIRAGGGTSRAAARHLLAWAIAPALASCAGIPAATPGDRLQILAINDFHGNLLPSPSPVTYEDGAKEYHATLGGAAQMAATLDTLRQSEPHTITVAAGDLVGASPLVSAYFLDEPTITALNAMGLDIASVGNHEFDRGTVELRRMQEGGCAQGTARQSCAIEPFGGAKFTYLAGNTVDADGRTLFPGTTMRRFGALTVGFVGLTLRTTGEIVSPTEMHGYRFLDEAQTANTLARQLREQGADEVVLLLHQGADVSPIYNTDGCPSLSGDILPILDALDPAIRLVVSGHTHQAYICELPTSSGSTRLLTSAGRYGYFVTDITAGIDPRTHRFTTLAARNVPVDGSDGEQPDIARLVQRYVAATEPVTSRVAGMLSGQPADDTDCVDSWTGDLIADAQLAASATPAHGGAEIAFMNSGGVRAVLTPAADGAITFGQLFATQPFGNTLVVLEMTGAQVHDVLEQQFCDGAEVGFCHSSLTPSANLTYAFDTSRPSGARITGLALDGHPLDPAAAYRVVVNNFLAGGGDGFDVFAKARSVGAAGNDVEALEAYLGAGAVRNPVCGRVRDVSP